MVTNKNHNLRNLEQRPIRESNSIVENTLSVPFGNPLYKNRNVQINILTKYARPAAIKAVGIQESDNEGPQVSTKKQDNIDNSKNGFMVSRKKNRNCTRVEKRLMVVEADENIVLRRRNRRRR
jgi:hypothetical protein